MQLFDDPTPPSTLLSDEQKLSWLRLLRSENVGPATFKRLINRYGTAENALNALPHIASRGGAKRPIRVCPLDEAEQELDALKKIGGELNALCEPNYPYLLKQISGAPPLLSVLGNLPPKEKSPIAMVGARNASAAGMALTRQLAGELGEMGYAIISGLARGIDSAAHTASVKSGTVAVFAGGVDHIYPSQNANLANAIIDNGGALISEMPLGRQPTARDFPRRNRIVSGMSLGVIVVEAAIRSGSLITARLASEQNREVMAIPGFPLDPRAEGGNKLIRDGATLVRNTKDIVEQISSLHISSLQMAEDEFDETTDWQDDLPEDANRLVLDALSHTPTPIDELVRTTLLSAQMVQSVLLELEIAGRLERASGQLVALKLSD
jgi:DNA processing protein